MKKIAVVVLNWNGQKLLETFLPSVVAHATEAALYLVDNASSDDSVLFVKTHYPQIHIIQNPDNYGFAQGYNLGLAQIEEPYYVLLNSDVEVTPNWLQRPLTIFETQPEVGIIQPKILDDKNPSHFEYAGAAGGFIDALGYPYCRGRIFDTLEQDLGQYNDEKEIFWASGACFFIRKEVFRTLHGFDADFFAHQEEIDLCWRAFNKGFTTVYTSQSVVYHLGGGTLKESNPQKTYLNFRNSLLLLVKNLPSTYIAPIILMRLILDGIAGIQLLVHQKPKHCWAIIRAHFSFYSVFFKTLKKRTPQQKKKYYREKSIVWKYFIKNGKVFE